MAINFINLAKRAAKNLRGGHVIPVAGIIAIQGSSGAQAGVDEVVNALQIISVEHHEIHEGHHFFCGDDDQDVDTGAVKYWLIRAPDSGVRIHLRFRVSSSLNGTVRLYENPTLGGDGSKLVCYNNDRNSTIKARIAIFADPTVNAAGTELFPEVMGSDGVNVQGSDGGLLQREDEIILKRDEEYLIAYTTESDNNRVSFLAEFYEE